MTELTAAVEEKGYTYFDWDLSSGDADAVTVEKDTIVSTIKEKIGNRKSVVILMHDSVKKTTTVDALPEIIEFLQSKGFALLPITENTPAPHAKVAN